MNDVSWSNPVSLLKNEPAIPGPPERRRIRHALTGVGVIVALLLLPLGWKLENVWSAGAWNLLHLPGFFLLTRFLFRIFAGRILPSVGLALATGIVSEVLQSYIGRSASLHDVILDGFGILLALAWPGQPGRWPASRVPGASLILLAGITFAFFPALTQSLAERTARAHLPEIGPFSGTTGQKLWWPQGRAVAEVDAGTGALRVRIEPGTFGGVHFRSGGQDWSSYSEVVFSVSNPGAPLRLGVRIDDAQSSADRVWLSDEIRLDNGISEARIPLTGALAPDDRRRIDLTQIVRLVLFVDKTEIPVEFSLQSAVLR
jgi:hypothetical protein